MASIPLFVPLPRNQITVRIHFCSFIILGVGVMWCPRLPFCLVTHADPHTNKNRQKRPRALAIWEQITATNLPHRRKGSRKHGLEKWRPHRTKQLFDILALVVSRACKTTKRLKRRLHPDFCVWNANCMLTSVSESLICQLHPDFRV